MPSFLKTFSVLACAAAAALCLLGCSPEPEAPPEETAPEVITLPAAPLQEETLPADPRTQVEELTVVLSAGEIYTLEQYPNLKSADLTGSTCYDAILNYMSKHPEVDVTYTVALGTAQVGNRETSATLASGTYDPELLAANLQFLPQLQSLTLSGAELTAEQAEVLRQTYPDIAIRYTVELLSNSYDVSTRELDLSTMGSSQVSQVTSKLGLLTELESVQLNNALSFADVEALQKANPGAVFHYRFTLFGKTVSTADTEIIYTNQNIGTQGEDQLRQALPILNKCQRFVLDNCGMDYEVLSRLREDFRGRTKIVWRVRFGVDSRYSFLTDSTVLRCVENVTDSTCGPLKYCEDAIHVDLGHNDTLTDLSFVQYMTKLETLIVSGCAVTDLSGFENCKNLLWLEMAYCGKLKNIEPLAGCESLKYLNLSYTKVSSFMALDGLPLERFVCLGPRASTKEQNTFTQIHPKSQCITVFYGYKEPYGYGWRYNDNGRTMFSYYKDVIRVVFDLDKADAILKAQGGN